MKSQYQTIVIDVPMDDEGLEQLMYLKKSPLLINAKKVILLTIYNETMGHEVPSWIINKNDFENIEQYILDRLESVTDELCPSLDAQEKWFRKCLFNGDPKLAMLEFLKEVHADLTISANKGELGMCGVFRSSTSNHLIETSPCDVYVVRPVHQSL